MALFLQLLLASVLAFPGGVRSLRNITVQEDSSALVYSGSWTRSQQNVDSGGYHKASSEPSATATFTFTGVAIYYMAALWPHYTNTILSLDSGPPVMLNLTDPYPFSHSDTEILKPSVIWAKTGLENTKHTITISVAKDGHGIVDALVYTIPDLSTSTQTSISLDPPATASLAAAATTATQPSLHKGSHNALPIAIGTVFGTLGLSLFAFAIWYHLRRRSSTPPFDPYCHDP